MGNEQTQLENPRLLPNADHDVPSMTEKLHTKYPRAHTGLGNTGHWGFMPGCQIFEPKMFMDKLWLLAWIQIRASTCIASLHTIACVRRKILLGHSMVFYPKTRAFASYPQF